MFINGLHMLEIEIKRQKFNLVHVRFTRIIIRAKVKFLAVYE